MQAQTARGLLLFAFIGMGAEDSTFPAHFIKNFINSINKYKTATQMTEGLKEIPKGSAVE